MKLVIALVFLAFASIATAQVRPFSLGDGAYMGKTSRILSGLAGYWKFEESSGVRIDATGITDLTPTNGVIQASGKVNFCAAFNSASNMVLMASSSNSISYTKTQALTVAAWVKLTNNSINQAILSKFDTNASKGFDFIINAGKIWFELDSSGSAAFWNGGSTVITNAAWHLCIATYDGSASQNGINLYVDNATETNHRGSAGSFTDVSNIGVFRVGNAASLWANGLIDEVAVWTRVISASEMSQLWDLGTGTTWPKFQVMNAPYSIPDYYADNSFWIGVVSADE